ncbi:peptidase M24 family protein [Sulfodiicoccus acidiphilus]|uniref:Peptidase M24 family protein n=1 Tax=Sulfodiicoccus acidiphilus TaxID=1670455 RepID=A0A348B3R3_9CREN|nr:aminopeptidase P family protein [Sulfodiicoccus acidiphilus]BBD72815.1 peptidase M24 family protein [Sulfodiicoccus acidiphilus]GGU04277.1 peptidase M24 family protein [Sulfodiicoccus acidiphilus]
MDRIARLREKMMVKGIDYVLLGPNSDCFYLTSFREEQMERPLLFVVSLDDHFFLAPKLYDEQITQLGYRVEAYGDGEDPFSKLTLERGRSVYLDDWLPTFISLSIVERYGPSKVGRASELLSPMRAVKDEDEIALMETAVRVSEKVLEEVLPTIKEGLSEKHVSRLIENKARELGSQGPSFEPIVTSGPNTSMPHMRSTDRKLKNGDPIVLDYGIRWKGYNTDTTRTVFLSRPSAEVERIYNVVKEAQSIAEERVRSGMSGAEADSLARTVISRAGLGQFFIHRTGHGIGIDVHEPPYISKDNEEPLVDGNVFTVEPGVYLPGKLGVRIEDMVILRGRAQVMNSLSKEILVL